MKPDYKGFDVLENMIRSLEWNQIPCDKAKIGTLSYWEEQVLSKMEVAETPKRKINNP